MELICQSIPAVFGIVLEHGIDGLGGGTHADAVVATIRD